MAYGRNLAKTASEKLPRGWESKGMDYWQARAEKMKAAARKAESGGQLRYRCEQREIAEMAVYLLARNSA